MGTIKKDLELEKNFPNLSRIGYEVTSDKDNFYNCIAWAAGEENTDQFWTHLRQSNGYYWPQNLPKNASLNTYIQLFEETCGYSRCNNGNLEEGYEKIALYTNSNNEIRHAARQLSDGTWTSKMGLSHDIMHKTPEALYNDAETYGKVVQFLKRDRKKKAE